MKKIISFAAFCAVALGAAAAYNVNPEASTVLAQGKVSSIEYVVLDEASLNTFTAQGAKAISWAPNDETRFFYIWDGTFTGGDGSYPGVGMHFDGYTSLVVGSSGWSGAGYNVNKGAGVDASAWNDETRFHLAYMSAANAPASVGLIINNQDDKNTPANISLGEAFNDNGNVFAIAGAASKDDWQAIDLSFADLKKLSPAFGYEATTSWTGNSVALLAGGVTGNQLSLDAIYFYNLGEGSGVAETEADVEFIITGKTVNALGVAGIELYDMAGRLVKATAGTTIGLDNLDKGVYVVRAGKTARKVAVL